MERPARAGRSPCWRGRPGCRRRPPPEPTGGLHAWPEVPLCRDRHRGAAAPRAGRVPRPGGPLAGLARGRRAQQRDVVRRVLHPDGRPSGSASAIPSPTAWSALLNFAAGFGDMRGDFEASFGDGRANTFAFNLGVLVRQPLSRRASLYLEADGGYYIRSLMWGGAFYDPISGEVTDGLVLEQQNWGGRPAGRACSCSARTRTSPASSTSASSVQTTPADRWDFWTERTALHRRRPRHLGVAHRAILGRDLTMATSCNCTSAGDRNFCYLLGDAPTRLSPRRSTPATTPTASTRSPTEHGLTITDDPGDPRARRPRGRRRAAGRAHGGGGAGRRGRGRSAARARSRTVSASRSATSSSRPSARPATRATTTASSRTTA